MIRGAVRAAAICAALAALPAATARAASDEEPALRLASQTFVLPGSDSSLAMSLAVDGLDGEACETIAVTAFAAVDTRAGIREAADEGPIGRRDDIEVPCSSVVITGAGNLQLPEIPIRVANAEPTEQALLLPEAGVVPLQVEVRYPSRAPLALTTFVDRLDDGENADTPVDDPLRAAMAVSVDGGPTLQPDGSRLITNAERADLQALVELINSAPDAPLTVSVRPELVEGLASSTAAGDEALLAELRAALAGHDVLSMPYVDLDPTAAQQAAMTELFTAQMTLGEDAVRDALQIRSQRAVWPIHSPLGDDAAQQLRGLGVRMVVVLPPDPPLALAQPSEQYLVPLPDGGTLLGARADPQFGELLAEPGDDPTLAAYRAAAEMLATRQEVLDGDFGSDRVADHGIILMAPDGGLPDPAVTVPLLSLLQQTPQLSFVQLSTMVDVAQPSMVGGTPAEGPLPDVVADDLTDLGNQLDLVSLDAAATGSMLLPDDPLKAAWTALINVAPSAALDGERRQSYLNVVSTQASEIRSYVVPPGATGFTLGSRHSKIRIPVRNDGPTPLTVLLHFDQTSKLQIVGGDQQVVLNAFETTTVEVEVEARTNGQIPITVQVLTPEWDQEVTPKVVLTARVNAFTGLGQLVTGAAALVLLTWWVHHIRLRRRRQRLAAAPSL